MATHSVPQDVEADDKLIGFLSLKQFIFTIIGLGFGYLTFFFFTKVHPLASIIWLPFMIVFLVLGLYQRKDQPVEVYLASALGFYFKPRTRVWNQDGYEERVIITAPPVVEKHYTKNFTGEEAVGRLEGLSLMMDSRGWASKKVEDWQNPQLATIATDSDRLVIGQEIVARQGLNPQQYIAQPADPYDDRSIVGKQFEHKIVEADNSTHQEALRIMHEAGEPIGITEPRVPIISTPSVLTIQDDSSADATTTQTEATEANKKNVPKKPVASTAMTVKQGKKSDNELNIPHKTDDGSVELRLH